MSFTPRFLMSKKVLHGQDGNGDYTRIKVGRQSTGKTRRTESRSSISGQPGCIRYCAGSSIPASSSINGRDGDVTITNWSTERLVDIDSVQRSITYEIVDCNIGFKSYVSTMKVVPYNNGENDEDNGCLIEWSFVVDPIQGWELETLVSKFDSGLQRTASKIEATLNNKATNVSGWG
ncbi:uncharacterized protein LOC113353627 isoform X4 [Papaver somniferum]|uniref:uncharacterized protein LOC113353627 isoform X4 n=1 Tax=Papaver somniferum TaxID=3469 RepID=UPI000E6FD3EE|nr:uncharacterized protein LOC113353627 isoform X4 [Papaver somniferum]